MPDDAASVFRTGLEPAAGRLLLAGVGLEDPNFRRTVVYLLEHDDGGTVGVVLNRPSRTPVGQVLPDWHDEVAEPAVVFTGGPVQVDGALCLGELGDPSPGGPGVAEAAGGGSGSRLVRRLVAGLGSVDLDADAAVAGGQVGRLRIFAGHSGWAAGQLAGELAEGAWYVVPGTPADVFDADPRALWRTVLRRQPLPLRMLASYPGEVGLT